MFIKWVTESASETIQFSTQTIKNYNIDAKRIILQFGAWSKEMLVATDDKLANDEIGLPESIRELVCIPDHLNYELAVNGRTISIGPVIAFLISNKKSLRKNRLKRYVKRLANYDKINGLIYICSSQGINTSRKTIDGYYYNPLAETEDKRFVKGSFPYPGAMYKRRQINPRLYNDLISIIGDRVFNSYHFTKGELAEWMSGNQVAKEFLPHTEKLVNGKQLENMLNNYSTVYLKPASGYGGNGIVMLTKSTMGFSIFEDGQREMILTDRNDLSRFVEYLLDEQDYILQQGISNPIHGRKIDFRIYMQKDISMKWNAQGIIARISKEGKVTTNLKQVEYLQHGLEAIKNIFKKNHQDAQAMVENLYTVSKKLCIELDESIGNYGDVAIDAIVDENGSIWILEVNKSYGLKSLRIIEDTELRRKLLTTPFEYAKALAGF